ncbi:MAG TPA: sugar ABC transporter permease [Bacillota bacterium]|nr:sugar ABC transporter permease [Bacillota bacterium]
MNEALNKSAPVRLWHQIKQNRLAYAFLLPSLLAIVGIILLPVIQVLTISFQHYYLVDVLTKGPHFVGLDNYLHILQDPKFWYSLLITVIFTAACVGFTMLVGLAVALLLHQDFPGNKIVGIAILIPWVMPRVASSILWRWIYDDQYGILNYFLNALGLNSFASFAWLGNAIPALVAVTVVIVWQSFPFIAISLLAGLQAIPVEIYEAATIDGAGFRQQLRYITLPVMRNLIGILTIISTIWDFKIFDQMWVLTEGGPAGSTTILGIYTWSAAFARLRMDWAAAAAVIILLVVSVVTFIYLKLFMKGEEEVTHG